MLLEYDPTLWKHRRPLRIGTVDPCSSEVWPILVTVLVAAVLSLKGASVSIYFVCLMFNLAGLVVGDAKVCVPVVGMATCPR